jgi:MFS family permease
MAMPDSSATFSDRRRLQRRVRSAVIVGSALEWFDFLLYASMSALIFNRVFFSNLEPATATLASLATFGVGFLARPFGGIVLGALADRIGRKTVLMITFVLMGVSSGLIGLVPTYDSIGVAAPIMLVVLRLFQGLGAGAETASATAVSYEYADPDRKGSAGAWPALGSNIGLFAASIVVAILAATPDEFLYGIGWRIPFVASFVLVFLGLIVRARLPETPEFTQAVADDKIIKHKSPLRSLVKNHWRGLLICMVVYFGYNGAGYLFKTFSLAYMTTFRDIDASAGALAVAVATGVAVIMVPIAGRLTDALGAGRVVQIGAVLIAVLAFPFFWLIDSGNPILICIAITAGTGIAAPTAFAAQGAFMSQQFPVEVRNSGISTGREVGGAIAGGAAPIIAMAIVQMSPTHATWGVSLLFLLAAASMTFGVVFAAFKNAHVVAQAEEFSRQTSTAVEGMPSVQSAAESSPPRSDRSTSYSGAVD